MAAWWHENGYQWEQRAHEKWRQAGAHNDMNALQHTLFMLPGDIYSCPYDHLLIYYHFLHSLGVLTHPRQRLH